jgi:segregation and condensation protein B
MSNPELKKILEAARFTAPSAMTVKELAGISRTNVAEVRVALNELIHEYSDRDTAIGIFEDSGGFRMSVKKAHQGKVAHLASAPEFHKGVQKTLAFIAYKQPIRQSEVIKFRNTKAYDHIHILLERGFITKERIGPTFVLRTTKKFLQYFGSEAAKMRQRRSEDVQNQPNPEKV